MSEEDLIPVFVPALGATLISAEDRKGEPLTRDEVLAVRDAAACIMMTTADAEKLDASRGYDDLDPENCWYDFQMLRRALERKPDLEPGVRVNHFQRTDPEYQATIEAAQDSLDEFRELLPEFDSSSALIKTELSDGEAQAFVWLMNTQASGEGFVAELFEVPDSISGLQVGQAFEIGSEAILDWMINDDGRLHGGFSLRYHREKLSAKEQAAFDTHIGVINYD